MSAWRAGAGLVATVLLVSAAWLLMAWRPPTMVEALSNAVSDHFYQWQRHDPPGNVVFIEVDNASVRALGRWPWSRDVIAEGLAQLYLAQAVGVDILFSEPTSDIHDQQLADALAQLPSIGGAFLNGPLATEMSDDA